MTAPKNALATKKGRYYVKDGQRFISVTNVIDTCLNKPALVGWAARTVAEEAVGSLVELTRMCRADKAAAIDWLKGRPYAKKDQAAKLGSRVHDLAERHGLGQDLGEIEPEALGMVEQYVRFLDDWKPAIEATEATVCNRTVGYAGSLDALMRIPALDDRLLVVDYKTGATGPYPEWALQLAAYRHAEALWLPDGTEVPMPEVQGGLILRLRPDMYSLHEMRVDGPVFDTFCRMVATAVFMHEEGDGCVGAELPVPTAELEAVSA